MLSFISLIIIILSFFNFPKIFRRVFRKAYYIHIGKIKNKISLKDKIKK